MKLSRLLHRIGAAILILTGMTGAAHAASAAVTGPEGYPRLALYGSIRGNGYPYYNAPLDSAIEKEIDEPNGVSAPPQVAAFVIGPMLK